MPRYELRLTLPDHPGSFGAAASAIGCAGANIVSFETVETAEGIAVDQLLLDLDATKDDKDVLAAARMPQPRRLSGSVGAPTLVGAATPWLPLTRTTVLPLGDWTPSRWQLKESQAQVAAAPLNQTGDTALVTVRRAGPAFRQREIRILAVLAMIAGRLGGMDPPKV